MCHLYQRRLRFVGTLTRRVECQPCSRGEPVLTRLASRHRNWPEVNMESRQRACLREGHAFACPHNHQEKAAEQVTWYKLTRDSIKKWYSAAPCAVGI